MKQAIQEPAERTLMILQILLVGMLAKGIIKDLINKMLDLYILHIMKDMVDLKEKHTEKSSGLLKLLIGFKQDLQNINNSIGDVLKN